MRANDFIDSMWIFRNFIRNHAASLTGITEEQIAEVCKLIDTSIEQLTEPCMGERAKFRN